MHRLSCDVLKDVKPMPMTIDITTFLAEAAGAASVKPCRHVDGNRRPGYILALAGRCAR
jgi:hypothetical protein